MRIPASGPSLEVHICNIKEIVGIGELKIEDDAIMLSKRGPEWKSSKRKPGEKGTKSVSNAYADLQGGGYRLADLLICGV
jgi:hypothetical protein